MSEQMASTLVFYDWDGELHADGWLELSEEFFALVGSTANAAAYRCGEFSTRKISVHELSKFIKEPDIRSVELHQLADPFDDFNKCTTYAGFNIGGRKKTALFSYGCPEIDVDLFSGITQKMAKLICITYGHAFLRSISRGPVMFAYDLSYGSGAFSKLDRREERAMNIWRVERLDMIVQNKPAPFRHLSGFLRDIYPMNVLTVPHLQQTVFGKPLVEWIASDAARGYLQQITERIWIWVVSASNLPQVRDALSACGLLIAGLAPDE